MGFKVLTDKKDYLYSVITNVITILLSRWIAIYFYNQKSENNFWYSTRILTIVPMTLWVVLGINVFYLVLYFGKFDYFERMKVTNTPWPWEQNLKRFKKRLPTMIMYYALNLLVIGTSFVIFLNKIYIPKGRNEESDMPQLPEIYLQLFISILLEDFIFFFSHRFLHMPFVYKYVHKVHHENAELIHINCIYTHPIETILGNFVPVYFPLFVMGKKMHFVTLYIWLMYRYIETHEAHGGYEFKYTIFDANPFNIEGDYHNFHHNKNSGNYATFFKHWDWYFGSNKAYIQAKTQKQQ